MSLPIDKRRRNVSWSVVNTDGGVSWEGLHAAVLMDIRDELQKLNSLLHCGNCIDIPRVLRQIRANTAKPRKKAER